MKKIIILCTLIFLLTGCFDYQELNDMAIVNGIGIDYKDNKYQISLEIIKSQKDGNSTEITSEVITATDKNLANAFNKTISKSSKKIYLKHVKILVLSEKISKKGISKILDYIIRDISISNNFNIVVSKNAHKILNKKLENESITDNINDILNLSMDVKDTYNIDMIASKLNNNKVDIALPYLELKKNISISKIAYFKGDQMLGIMSDKMYNFFVINSNQINFTNDNNVLNIYKKKINYEVKENKITINITGYGKIKEVNEHLNLEEVSSYSKINKLINEEIKKQTYEFINKIKEKSDLLGFKEIYYNKYRKKLKNIKYDVKVNIKLNRNGSIYEVLNDK